MSLGQTIRRGRRLLSQPAQPENETGQAGTPRGPTVQEVFADRWAGLCALPEDVATPAVSGKPIAPDVTFWLDDEQGRHELLCRPAMAGGINLKTTVTAAGRWMGLHFRIGQTDLNETAVLGFYSQQRALRSCTWRACLRSGTADGFVDHFFGKHVVAYDGPGTHMDMLDLNTLAR